MGSQSPLIYSFVARGSVILAEYCESIGYFTTVASRYLHKLPATNNNFTTYDYDRHTFHYLVEDGFAYCVVADESFGTHVPVAFLERMKDDFTENYGGGKAATATVNSLNKEFGPKLKEHMQYCIDHLEEINNLSRFKAQVSEVKGEMMENIEQVLDPEEKIEILVNKTDNLRLQEMDTCGSYASQVDYGALMSVALQHSSDLQLSNIFTSEIASDIRESGISIIRQLCSELGPLTEATAIQYFDVLLSESHLDVLKFSVDWAIHCARLASKVVTGEDLDEDLSLYSFSHDLDLARDEILLLKKLNQKLCLPTVYTLFHCLVKVKRLSFCYGESFEDDVAAKSHADRIIIDALRERDLLRYRSNILVAALVLLLCDVPKDVVDLYDHTDEDDVNKCLTILKEMKSSSSSSRSTSSSKNSSSRSLAVSCKLSSARSTSSSKNSSSRSLAVSCELDEQLNPSGSSSPLSPSSAISWESNEQLKPGSSLLSSSPS